MIRRGVAHVAAVLGLAAGGIATSLSCPPPIARRGGSPLQASWVGTPVPPMTLATTTGTTLDVGALRGRPVVLVFWETWCAACRRELPHLERLAREVPEVAVVAVSDEPMETLRAFAARRPLSIPLASLPEPPAPFDVRAIPTNVFIDRKGVIRAVRVASLDFEDLEALATGPDFVPTPPARAAGPAPDDFQPRWSAGVRRVTSMSVCDWDGDGAAEIVAAAGKALHVIDAEGREKARVVLAEPALRMECAAMPDASVRVLAYETWAPSVAVLDASGKTLWSYDTEGGVDGAHWGDLDGDGWPELVAGLNGEGGLHAVSHTGQRRWHAGDLKNVWNQAVVPHGGGATVAVTQAGGAISLFDGAGVRGATLRPRGEYYAPIAAALLPGGGLQIVAATETEAVAFDARGEVSWRAPASAPRDDWSWPVFASGDLTGDGAADWVFPSRAHPRTLSVHTTSGERRGALRLDVPERAFAVLPRPGKGLLVIADEVVRAFELK